MNPSEIQPESEAHQHTSRNIPLTTPDGHKIMATSDLLLKTEASLALNRDRDVSLIETVYNIMRPYVPYHYVIHYLAAAARLLAEYRPTQLAHIIDQYPGVDPKSGYLMLQEAERFIHKQYGRRNAVMIIGAWLRCAAEGRPYPGINQSPA